LSRDSGLRKVQEKQQHTAQREAGRTYAADDTGGTRSLTGLHARRGDTPAPRLASTATARVSQRNSGEAGGPFRIR